MAHSRDVQNIVWHFRDWQTCRNSICREGVKTLLILQPVVTEQKKPLTLYLHWVVVSGMEGSRAHRAMVFNLIVRWNRQPGTGSALTMGTVVVRLIYPCPFVLTMNQTNNLDFQRWSDILQKLLLLHSTRNLFLSSTSSLLFGMSLYPCLFIPFRAPKGLCLNLYRCLTHLLLPVQSNQM